MPPINDDFEEAINIRSNNYYSSSINTKYFSREENEPLHSGRLEGGSVWWRWTAPDECEVSFNVISSCLLYTSPSQRDRTRGRMPSSA